jgi:hypothetical protein
MGRILSRAWRYAPALAAVVIILGCVTEANAFPRGGRMGRMGRMYIPQPPANIDSSPMIDGLNKVLKTLSETSYSFDGHLEKAVNHIHAAIVDLQVPNASAKSQGTSAAGAASPATKTVATLPADSEKAKTEAILHRAKTELYALYHKMNDKDSTRGRIHAAGQVLTAIQELISAEKVLYPAGVPVAKSAAAAPVNPLSRFMIK